MKLPVSTRRAAGFTLAEMMIVISIIVILAALTIGGYNYAMRGSKRRTTEATLTAVQSSLERYFDKFGEFPEPVSADEMLEVMPKKSYRIGGAKCLYQALTGDGFDSILGAANSAATGGGGGGGASDGNYDEAEIPNVLFKDIPKTMWRRVNNQHFMIVDGFSRPFQYIKAAPQNTSGATTGGGNSNNQATTINTTYDLWSYGDDEVNILARSVETLQNQALGNKWITNW